MFLGLLSTITSSLDGPASVSFFREASPRNPRSARATPSTDHMSGWLLSLTSTFTVSVCSSSDSTSPLTYAKTWFSPSLSLGSLSPSRFSRSDRDSCTDGVLLDRLFPDPFEVCSENLAYVLYSFVHHVEPVDTKSPS